MLRYEAGNEVIDFALPACDCHAGIVGEGKANVKRNQPLAISSGLCGAQDRVERALLPACL